jgi:hypothetical protein
MKLGGDVAVTRAASLWAPISGKSDASDHRSQRGIRPSTRTRHGHRIAEQAQDGCVKPGDGRQAARSALPRRSLARPVHRPVYAKETADALAAEKGWAFRQGSLGPYSASRRCTSPASSP